MSYESIMEEWDRNMKAITAKDTAAKEKGILLGRYIQEQYADGYAFYEIIKVNKKSVRIQVLTGLGDDWMIPMWGQKTSIPMKYAVDSVARRDGLAKFFSKK